jgi:phosphoglycolate phosphatase-like HAD superfamily hydrolase
VGTLFLDLDGTLTDISKRLFDVYVTCLEAFDGTPLAQSEYWELKRDKKSWSEILALSGVGPESENEFLEKFISIIETPEELDKDTLFDDVLPHLKDLSNQHQLILVSLRRNRNELLSQLERLGIKDFFTTVLSGHSETAEGTLTKKAEAISEWGGGADHSAISIGDGEADIASAKQLGIRSIAVTSGIRNRVQLEKYSPDIIVDTFAQAVAEI